jgi:hypothetical protein
MRSNIDDKMITDISLAEGGYNYYLFVSSGTNSTHVIMRENAAQTEYRYAFGIGDPTFNWTNRTTVNYIRPNQLGGRD